MNKNTLQRIGGALRDAAQDKTSPLWDGRIGPLNGGCALVAQALHAVLDSGEVYGVWLDDQGDGYKEWVHAAVRVGDGLLDGNGYQSADELLAQYLDCGDAELLPDPDMAGAANEEAWMAGFGDPDADARLVELTTWLRGLLN